MGYLEAFERRESLLHSSWFYFDGMWWNQVQHYISCEEAKPTKGGSSTGCDNVKMLWKNFRSIEEKKKMQLLRFSELVKLLKYGLYGVNIDVILAPLPIHRRGSNASTAIAF